MKRFCLKSKKRKSQQLLEFLLIAPFIMMVMALLIEYAYAFNINMTLRQGLRTVTSNIYSEMRPGITQAQIRTLVQYNLAKYLQSNNIAVSDTNPTVSYTYSSPNSTTPANQTAVFAATFTYNVAFTLPNLYSPSGRHSMFPDSFTFFTTVAVPSAFLTQNNYPTDPARLNSDQLDRIWSDPGSFGTIDKGFNEARDGIMRVDPDDPTLTAKNRGYILFMVPWNDLQTAALAGRAANMPTTANTYVAMAWDGAAYHTTGAQLFVLDINTPNGSLYTCASIVANTDFACTPVTNWNLLDFVKSTKSGDTGYPPNGTSGNSMVIFIPSADLISIKAKVTPWISGADTTGDLCPNPDNVSGILKKAISLQGLSFPMNGRSLGNYDNLDVSGYNTSFDSFSSMSGWNFIYRPLGSIAFVYPNNSTAAAINTNILPGINYSTLDYNYDFSAK